MPVDERDRQYMEQALRLAARARGRTHPNPMVGCVLVSGGRVVGTGYHQRAGEPHAEVHALREAGERARGATAYVTLEPCAHHDRTPPCADALVAAGVRRVVAAMVDPDPRTAGRGIERLRAAGIQVEVGLMAAEAEALNRAWITWKRTGRPLVILKWAMTLDGKIASVTGHSRWVTGAASRSHAHQVRDQVDAILVGAGTQRADDPELTARPDTAGPLPGWAGGIDPGPDLDWQPKDPLRVVLASTARIDPDSRILSPHLLERPRPARTLVACTDQAAPERVAAIEARGGEVLRLPAGEGGVALGPLLDELGRRGVTSLLVEGGGEVHWSFLSRGLADYLMLYLSPKIIGGREAPGPVAGWGLERMGDAWELEGAPRVTRLGEDLLLEGFLKKKAPAKRGMEHVHRSR